MIALLGWDSTPETYPMAILGVIAYAGYAMLAETVWTLGHLINDYILIEPVLNAGLNLRLTFALVVGFFFSFPYGGHVVGAAALLVNSFLLYRAWRRGVFLAQGTYVTFCPSTSRWLYEAIALIAALVLVTSGPVAVAGVAVMAGAQEYLCAYERGGLGWARWKKSTEARLQGLRVNGMPRASSSHTWEEFSHRGFRGWAGFGSQELRGAYAALLGLLWGAWALKEGLCEAIRDLCRGRGLSPSLRWRLDTAIVRASRALGASRRYPSFRDLVNSPRYNPTLARQRIRPAYLASELEIFWTGRGGSFTLAFLILSFGARVVLVMGALGLC